MTVREELAAVADHIQRVGHWRDGHFYQPTSRLPKEERPCCVIGALAVIRGGEPAQVMFFEFRPDPTIDALCRIAFKHSRFGVMAWSDRTPTDQLLDQLRQGETP